MSPLSPCPLGTARCDLWDQGGPTSNDRVLLRGREERPRHRGEAPGRQRQRREGGGHEPRDAWSPQKLEEAGRGPSPGASGGSVALGHLDLRRLVPRAGGGCRSVWGFSLQFMGTCYGCPRGHHPLKFCDRASGTCLGDCRRASAWRWLPAWDLLCGMRSRGLEVQPGGPLHPPPPQATQLGHRHRGQRPSHFLCLQGAESHPREPQRDSRTCPRKDLSPWAEGTRKGHVSGTWMVRGWRAVPSLFLTVPKPNPRKPGRASNRPGAETLSRRDSGTHVWAWASSV